MVVKGAIMNDRNLPTAASMRVGIFIRFTSVCGPTCVSNSWAAVELKCQIFILIITRSRSYERVVSY